MNIDKRLIKLLKPSGFTFFLTIILGTCAAISTIFQAWLLSKIISDVFLGKQDFFQVSNLLFLFAVASITRMLFQWAGQVKGEDTAGQIKNKLRSQLNKNLRNAGPAYLKHRQSGEISNTWLNGVDALHLYFSAYLPQLAFSVIVPIIILIFVFPADLLSGFILLFTAPIIPIFMILIGHTAQAMTNKQWQILSRMSAHFLDILEGLTTLKIFGKSREKTEAIFKISNDFRKITMNVLKVAFLSALVLEMAATLSTAVIAVEIGLRLLYAKIQFQQALFILILAPEFYQPLRQLGTGFHAGMEGVSALQSIFEILNKTDNYKQKSGSISLPLFENNIKFDQVFYTYPDSRSPAIENLSFEISFGSKTALVGASGSGKSTIASLLCGFMPPDKGKISIGKNNLNNLNLLDWRNQLSWIPQNPYLFHKSVLENILLAKPEATNAEVQKAAKQAHLHEFIMQLPDQYNTIIGEGGTRLSGGQAQRLALARAFIKEAPFLILDEPTSNIDPLSEQLIIESINRLCKNHTILIIAHRLSTIETADNILVLADGILIEQGSHKNLLKLHGIYANLVKSYGGELSLKT